MKTQINQLAKPVLVTAILSMGLMACDAKMKLDEMHSSTVHMDKTTTNMNGNMESMKTTTEDMKNITDNMNKNTDTAAMELMIGNMNLRISNETAPLLLAKTIQILAELSC